MMQPDTHDEILVTLPIVQRKEDHVLKPREYDSLKKDLNENRRRRKLIGKKGYPNSSETIAVYQDYGAYYIDIYLGTPAQRQTLLIDTGSVGTALPCSDCLDCGESNHTNTHFAEQLSSSFQNLTCSECLNGHCNTSNDVCDVNSHYAEGSSWHGAEVKDLAYPGGPHDGSLDPNLQSNDDDVFSGSNPNNAVKYRFSLKFTCMDSMVGAFKSQQANGIMGLGLRDSSIWQQMYAAGALKSKKFSICFRKHPFTPQREMTRSVGALTFGGIDTRLNSSEMKYMQFKNSHDLYSVHVKDIFVHPGGGQKLSNLDLSPGMIHSIGASEKTLNQGFMILDSGTTETILPMEIKPKIDMLFKKFTGMEFPTSPVHLSPEEMKRWPTFIFKMQGGTEAEDMLVSFPSSHYMLYDFINDLYVPRLQMRNTYKGRYGTYMSGFHCSALDCFISNIVFFNSILGSNFMRSHNVLFDIDNGRIGFADSNCDYDFLVTGKASEFISPYATAMDINKLFIQETCSIHPIFCFIMYSLRILTFVLFSLLMIVSLLKLLHFTDFITSWKMNPRRQGMTKLSLKDSSDDNGREDEECVNTHSL
jgi:hypothetical protein